ncbi:MAG TPA: hypothetical protein P5120_00380 [Spirochaetota bacterium]|nr:hypothetical protein [Spirochaetota bacterium]HPF04461.1 hypothetical protein [Spirochaetota bacterium]HPJ40767.1 hypothetical protein [Spirochaetota bacterium]HPR36036.1 hypothetical protein [Spirochaetota bacterium]HRX45950.1 hypothetical protein [Spirochaetota bacterium]
MFKKSRIIFVAVIFLLIVSGYFYFKYFFTYEQKNITQRKIESITGQNLTVTIFGFDGRIIKRWTGVKKITSFQDQRNYTFFYTKEGRYVQIPDSVWYIAEEE